MLLAAVGEVEVELEVLEEEELEALGTFFFLEFFFFDFFFLDWEEEEEPEDDGEPPEGGGGTGPEITVANGKEERGN